MKIYIDILYHLSIILNDTVWIKYHTRNFIYFLFNLTFEKFVPCSYAEKKGIVPYTFAVLY